MSIMRFKFILFYFFIAIYPFTEEILSAESSSSSVLQGQIDPNIENNRYLSAKARRKMAPFLLPVEHPMRAVLDSIFLEARVTVDRETFHQAGFNTIAKGPRSYIRVARHPQMPGY